MATSRRRRTGAASTIERRGRHLRMNVAAVMRHHLLELGARRFDRRYGIETRSTVGHSDTEHPERTENFTYSATQPRLASWWLGALPADVHDFVFIDMGSGKGRVLFLAATREFRELVGVEYAADLHQ